MASYRVLNEWFDGVKVRNPGEVVEFSGEPGASLEPLDSEAKRAVAAAAEARAKRERASVPLNAGSVADLTQALSAAMAPLLAQVATGKKAKEPADA
jgi:hypothetical protein